MGEMKIMNHNSDEIRFELSKKHSKQEKEEQGKSGFILAIAR